MTEKPLVSVIINCYNGAEYLREAIDSVIAQTYQNWELIFWDNQSTDSTAEIVKSYSDSRLHYFYAPEHTSLGKARNLAVEKANGEYINFIDADDVWAPEKLAQQIAIVEPGKVETVITGYEIIADENAKKLPLYAAFLYSQNKQKKSRLTYNDFLINAPVVVFSSVLFNKSIYREVGGIDPTLEQNEDFDIILKVSTKTDIGFISDRSTFYRIHSNNNSVANGVLGYIENRTIFSRLPQTPELLKAQEINETRIVAYKILSDKSYGLLFSEVLLKGRSCIFLTLMIKKFIRRILVLLK